MGFKAGERLSEEEVLEIEVARELGIAPREELQKAVFKATEIMGAGYFWPTKEEEARNNAYVESVQSTSNKRAELSTKMLAEHYGVKPEALVRSGVQSPRDQTPAEAAAAQERAKEAAKS